jgi:NTP pyrophosphatase (non-canonical NTP hydrolase)
MEFAEMAQKARLVREKYADVEARRYGRSWSREELMLGFLGDVGDLAKLVQGKEGVRPRDDLDAALAHELADWLWSVMVLADAYEVDLESAFLRTMGELSEELVGGGGGDRGA